MYLTDYDGRFYCTTSNPDHYDQVLKRTVKSAKDDIFICPASEPVKALYCFNWDIIYSGKNIFAVFMKRLLIFESQSCKLLNNTVCYLNILKFSLR